MRLFRIILTAFMVSLIMPMIYYAPIDMPIGGFIILGILWVIGVIGVYVTASIPIIVKEIIDI